MFGEKNGMKPDSSNLKIRAAGRFGTAYDLLTRNP